MFEEKGEIIIKNSEVVQRIKLMKLDACPKIVNQIYYTFFKMSIEFNTFVPEKNSMENPEFLRFKTDN